MKSDIRRGLVNSCDPLQMVVNVTVIYHAVSCSYVFVGVFVLNYISHNAEWLIQVLQTERTSAGVGRITHPQLSSSPLRGRRAS